MISPIRNVGTCAALRNTARPYLKIKQTSSKVRAFSCHGFERNNSGLGSSSINENDDSKVRGKYSRVSSVYPLYKSPTHRLLAPSNSSLLLGNCTAGGTQPLLLRSRHHNNNNNNNDVYHVHNNNNNSSAFYNNVRLLSLSAAKFDDKVEKTLKALREELEISERESKLMLEAKNSEMELKKKPLTQRIMHELKHYYHGFRLFLADFRISTSLLWQVMKGNQLSRQEKRQLIRTAADLFRLVPFLVFIIVPFMEFLLPVYLWLFPGALPSTFQERSKEDEKERKKFKVRLEMAKFLNATLEELSLERKGKEDVANTKVADFSHFLKKIREGGEYVSNTELLKYSKLFEDQLTLDNLSVAQLRALCRIVGINPIGTANILRFQLDMKLRELKADDRVIAKEGIDRLSIWELQAACRARGMRALGLSEERLKSQLNQWLELSQNEKVPPSLLLLSCTLYLPEEISFSDRLKTILTTLPTHTAEQIKLKLTEMEGGKVDNKSKLEIIQSIEASLKQQRLEEKLAKQIEEDKKALEAAKAALETAKSERSKEIPVTEQAPEVLQERVAVLRDAAKIIEPKKGEKIDVKDLDQIESLLLKTKQDELHDAKQDLKELKREIEDHKEDLKQVESIVVMKGEKISQSVAAKRLESTVNRMINKLDNVMDTLASKKTDLREEIAEGERKEDIKKDMITINELILNVRKLQKLPDDTKLQRVVDVLNALDEDKDGAIDVNSALKVIDVLGQENVKINPEQMKEIFELLKKEDLASLVEKADSGEFAQSGGNTVASGGKTSSNKEQKSSVEQKSTAVKDEKSRERLAQ